MRLLYDVLATLVAIGLILAFGYFAIDSLLLTPLPFK